MDKLKIFHPSGLVTAAVHQAPDENELGSLGREKRKQRNRKKKLDDLIVWVTERKVGATSFLPFEEEQRIRENIDKILKSNYLAKKGVLSIVGLNLTKKDRKRLEREVDEVAKYPDIDLFDREFKAQFAIGKLIDGFVTDRKPRNKKSWTSSELLSSLIVLMMVLHGITDKDQAVLLGLAAIHEAYAIKNIPMVGLLAKGEQQKGNPILTHKLLLSRAVLFLLKELRRRRKKESLEKLLQKKSFSESIKRRFKTAGIQYSGGYQNGLENLGIHISALREMYIPAYVRGLFDGGILSTPLPPLMDYACTTQQYPRHWPGTNLPDHVQVVIDRALMGVGEEEVSDDDFFSGLSGQIRIVEAIDCESREDYRLTLSEKVLDYLDHSRANYRLTAAQRLLGLFLWYMALVGIPQSLEDSSKGTLGTLRAYLSKAKNVILKIYGRNFDIEQDEECWGKGLRNLRELGQYDITTADRVHYFLDCMDALELMEVPSPSIIYKDLKKIDVPACSQLISLRAYERALEYINNHYDGAEAWLRTFAFMLMYRAGLRFCEVYEIKYNQVVICGELVDVYVGGRGQSQPKSKSANRRSSVLGNLTAYERDAIQQLSELKKSGSCANSYIYRCTNKRKRLLDRGRLQRSINSCLKIATGYPGARGHDCRKTNVNHVTLNFLLGEGGTHRLGQLWDDKLLPKMDIPRKWKRGGSRHTYFGDAIAARFGHADFGVTVTNYLVYAPELYQYYWQQVGLDEAIRPAMTNLSFGELETGHERYDFLERQYGTQGIPNISPVLITPPESLRVEKNVTEFPRNTSDVAHILSGRVPSDMSYAETRIGPSKDAITRVHEIAQIVANDRGYRSHDNDSFSAREWSPRQFFYDTPIPDDAISHFCDSVDSSSSDVYSQTGLWYRSYISEEIRASSWAERLTLESIEDFKEAVEHLKQLGFDPSCLVVEVLEGSDVHRISVDYGCNSKVVTTRKLRKYFVRNLGSCAVISISRDTSSKIQFSKRFHQLAFAAVVYQTYCGE